MTPHRCNRTELLRVLETVQPGLSPKETLQQSSCFVFRNGWVVTFNEEVCCRFKSGLPKEIVGAVKADPLLRLLRQLTHEDLEVYVTDGRFALRVEGKRTDAWVRMENEILLPVNDIERPDAAAWTRLPEEFSEAVGIVKETAGKDDTEFKTVCIHVHPKWLESCDRFQATRYRLATGVPEPFLVRQTSLRHVAALGMTETALTDTWVHYRNGSGLIMSCRRYVEDYPDMKPLFAAGGEPAVLPQGLGAAAKLAEIFSAEDKDDNKVTVQLAAGEMTVIGEGTSGGIKKGLRLKYDGPPTEFRVSPALLATLIEKGQDCEIGGGKLIVRQEKWRYVTSLAPVGKPAAPTPKADPLPDDRREAAEEAVAADGVPF